MRRKRVAVVLVGSTALLLLVGIVLGFPGSSDRALKPVPADATASLTAEPQPTGSLGQLTPTAAEPATTRSLLGTPGLEPTVIQVETTSFESEPTATAPLPTPTEPEPTPTEVVLGCCQCTAVGMDQDVPFHRPEGFTCAEWCFQGCLERGHGKLVCTLGRVSGYDRACPTAAP